MLELYAFNCLEENEQFKYLWNTGTFITSRTENKHTVALYDLHYFYVEVKYDAVSNHIDGIRSSKTLDLIEPYFNEHLSVVKSWLR